MRHTRRSRAAPAAGLPVLAPAAALLSLSLLAAGAALAGQVQVASFDDPAGDATGPGTYQPPTDGSFQDGDFDLRRFTVSTDGDEVVFEVTLGAPIRRPELNQRDSSSPVVLDNGIYLQNVDIYIDTSNAAGSGYSACIPGRRVAFADGRTWEAAVVLTPQPGPARAVVEGVLGQAAAAHVILPQGIQARGRTLTARVPALLLGGMPRPDWGYSVQVSGARWERSFAVVDRVRGNLQANAFTMDVQRIPDTWAFGGAPEGDAHPRVIDVLLPPGVDQRVVLGGYGQAPGDFARVPFVSLVPMAPAAPATHPPIAAGKPGPPLTLVPNSAVPPPKPPKPGPELKVAFIAGEMVSLSGLSYSLKPMQFGKVLGPDGTVVARVVIVQVLEGGAVATAVDNRAQIVSGARVRFDGP